MVLGAAGFNRHDQWQFACWAVGLQPAALETGLAAAGVNRRLYPAPSSVTTPVQATTAGMARPMLPKNPRLKPSCPRPRRLQDPPWINGLRVTDTRMSRSETKTPSVSGIVGSIVPPVVLCRS